MKKMVHMQFKINARLLALARIVYSEGKRP